jgi:putative MFS transporter
MQGFSQGLFVVGEVYSTLLLMADDPVMHDLHWRWLLRMSSIPSAVLGLLAIFLLHQSPMYYASTGKYEEAKAVLESMRANNFAHGVPIDFKIATRLSELPSRMRRLSRRGSISSKRDFMKQLRVVFGRQLRMSTSIVMYSCFVLNVVYFGCLYAMPQVLSASTGTAGGNAALQLLIGAVWELPGFAVGLAMGTFLPRILSIKIYMLLTAASLLCFSLCIGSYSALARAWMMVGYYGMKFCPNIGFVMVYQYSIELYPTEARTTGTAICLGSGRAAGIIAPIIFEAMQSRSGNPSDFFYMLLAFIASNLFLTQFLHIETQGVPLKDDVEDEETEGSSKSKTLDEEEAAPLLPSGKKVPLVQEPFVPR